MRQPAKVLYLLTSPPAQRPKEMDLKPVKSVTSGSAIVSNVDQPELELMLPTGYPEKASTEVSINEGSFKRELKQSSLPAVSSSCRSDGVLDLGDELKGNSQSPDAGEQLPASGIVHEHETKEKQMQSE